MIKQLLCISFLLVFIACQNNDENSATESSSKLEKLVLETKQFMNADGLDLEEHSKQYENLKSQILKYKNKLKIRQDIDRLAKLELAQNYMSSMLVDSVFHYWLGTKWDFNGTTEKPRDGEIACGYFVTTTLRDLGIKLNRYKIAQKGATDIIKDLCNHSSIERFSKFEKLEAHLSKVKEREILIVGLDYHVGFIYKKGDQSYFAHSNYIDRKGVEIELISESAALKSSNVYVLGNLTQNVDLAKNWLDQ